METDPPNIKSLEELEGTDFKYESIKDEMRRNLLQKLQKKENIFEGIIGFEKTVIPAIENAVLSKHNMILLGLRGQAKTRIARVLNQLFDEWTPIIEGCPLNSHPLNPVSAYAKRMVENQGKYLKISWMHRSQRYQEKLATPDVSMSDLIGDIDPIKAAREQRDLTDEEVIAYGIIPRSNRGIFTINELPDLQTRIQVGLLNILEENDIQIRGFPVRIPMDVVLVFTANPEDYTNRGNLITPLKDRIDSQIITHYPRNTKDSAAITLQEAWLKRGSEDVRFPDYFQDIVESVAFVARASEYVDKGSGVSQRLTISLMENIVSNMERRNAINDENVIMPRFIDLMAAHASVTGKIELSYEGEQEGLEMVASNIIGLAIKNAFEKVFPFLEEDQLGSEDPTYGELLEWFSSQGRVELSDYSSFKDYYCALCAVPNLQKIADEHIETSNKEEQALVMEFILEGMHQQNLIAKESKDGLHKYIDMMSTFL